MKRIWNIPCIMLCWICAGHGQDYNKDSVYNSTDIQAFMARVVGDSAYDPKLDFNADQKIDLTDALRYGQWINGLYHAPAYPPLFLTNPADTAAYQTYSRNVRDWGKKWAATDLTARFPFVPGQDPGYSADKVEFIDRLTTALKKADPTHASDTAYVAGYLRQLLTKGIAVYGGLTYQNYHAALDAIHNADLPLIFTTDALLHTLFLSYDNILMQLETNRFIEMIENVCITSLRYCDQVHGKTKDADDVRDYLATALRLLNPARTDITVSSQATLYLSAIHSEQFKEVDLFGRMKLVDFSQFKPRGHYTKSMPLQNYFKAMMWLSRADLAFEIGGKTATTRMKKDALILWDCVVNSGAYPQWLTMNATIEYMVGTSDGLSIKTMGNLVVDLGTTDIAKYIASFKEATFDSIVSSNRYGVQAILSEGIIFPTQGVDSLELSSICAFMPQRFILDSYTFSQLVFPMIVYRELPSSLDVAFVLGDNSALADYPEAMPTRMPGILGSQRTLYDQISPAGWQANAYTSWLNFQRTLNGIEANSAVSPAFRTAAWRAKMRNTQLMSWAQLRHNTILYAKQSYTGMIICQYPRAYVEPYPAFFAAVGQYAQKGAAFFEKQEPQVAAYFSTVAEISAKLQDIATLTAHGKSPTDAQVAWLQQTITSRSQSVGCGSIKVFDGWFFDLIYSIAEPGVSPTQSDYYTTIADVHTKPTDDMGPAKVLHCATGTINLMAIVVKLDTCTSVFVGPVGSFYDTVTVDPTTPKRMNDEEWYTRLQTKPDRPVWTKRYIFN
jgi:hypothetical protein